MEEKENNKRANLRVVRKRSVEEIIEAENEHEPAMCKD
jgi:hypothetical protein